MLSKHTLASLAETKAFAFDLSEKIKPGMLIGFSGELGSGKTTLIRYICEALQVKEQVSSPSFVLEHEYQTEAGLRIEHWDLYRVSSLPQELLEPCTQQIIRMVEWIEKAPQLLTLADIQISLCVTSKAPNQFNSECRTLELLINPSRENS